MDQPKTPFTPFALDALNGAWLDYRAACKPLYLSAPGIERDFLRTQDHERYIQMTRWLTRSAVAAVAKWTAACRRIFGTSVILEPLGKTGCGAPQCFLVRVPKAGGIAMFERLMGVPPKGDAEACARVALLTHRTKADRSFEVKARELSYFHDYHYAKMVAALKDSRVNAAYKQMFREWRARVPEDTADYAMLTKLAYFHHAKARRRFKAAVKWRNRLTRHNYHYVLDHIATPFEIVRPKEMPI